MISNCGHDENKKYTGGAAGDQTGTEWALIKWYKRPWKCVLRYPDESVRKKIAELAAAAAKNDKIGYDQGQRGTFWTQLVKSSYDPAKIIIPCEADCSSGVAAVVKATGYLLNITALKNTSAALTTSGMRAAFKKAGFSVLTDSKYLTSDAYLLAGDILLNDGVHTAINVTDGTKAASSTNTVNSAYYPVPCYSGSSIVEALASIGVGNTKAFRTKIAQANGISGYTGTAAQNTKLLNLLKNGKLIKI